MVGKSLLILTFSLAILLSSNYALAACDPETCSGLSCTNYQNRGNGGHYCSYAEMYCLGRRMDAGKGSNNIAIRHDGLAGEDIGLNISRK